MDKKHFGQEDYDKVVDFLNLIANKAEFKMNTSDVIKYFKLVSYMQQSILPKIKDHFFELEEIVNPGEPEENNND